MDNTLLKEFGVNILDDSGLLDDLKKMLNTFEMIQRNLYSIKYQEDDKETLILRIGTILTLSVIKKIMEGKNPSELTKEDCMGVAKDVSEYAVMVDDQEYSLFIFELYARYIEFSALTLEGKVSENRLNDICNLVEQLKEQTRLLKSESITETRYIENSLWICLEAMIKLLAVYSTNGIADEYGTLAYGLVSYSFEYGRLVLYRKEQEIVTQYLENQKVLDEELQVKYEEYLEELKQESDKFNQLLDNAFNEDFSSSLKASISFAKEVGLNEDELLTSIDDIDDFFMD